MIPDNIHNNHQDTTLFYIPFKHYRPATCSGDPKLVDFKKHKVHVYVLETNWEQLPSQPTLGSSLSLRIRPEDNQWLLYVKGNGKVLLSLGVHESINFKRLSADFVTVDSEQNQKVGFKFLSPTSEQLEELLTGSWLFSQLQVQSTLSYIMQEHRLPCLSVVKTFRHRSYDRGVTYKSLGIASKSSYLHIYKVNSTQEFLELTLDEIQENYQNRTEIVMSLYHNMVRLHTRVVPFVSNEHKNFPKFLELKVAKA